MDRKAQRRRARRGRAPRARRLAAAVPDTAAVNLVVDLADARFDHTATHHTLEALGTYGGIVPERHVHVPDRTLAQVDAIFGEAWSSQLAAGSAWIAHDDAGFVGIAGFDQRGSRYRWLRDVPPGRAVFGPFGFLKRAHPELKVAFLHGSMFALRERGYAQAVIGNVSDSGEIAFYEREAGARIDSVVVPIARRFRTVVLASGAGSNFAAVAERVQAGELPLELAGLVTAHPDAPVAERARAAGIPVETLAWDRALERRPVYDARLLAAVTAFAPDLVLLLGWMHVLEPAFIERFPHAINVHPAFLPLDPRNDRVVYPDGSESPAWRGPRAISEALAAGARWVGASAHRLSLEVDRGDILARAPLSVHPGEETAALLERLHPLEHRVVAAAIRRWADENA